MDLSILIVNWNTRDLLEGCLRSIRETAAGIAHEVIVVDNGSEDGSASMVQAACPEAVLIAAGENLGFAGGNNLAFERSSGRQLLLVNPDVVLLPGTIKGLMDFTDHHPDAGFVSPKLLNPDRTPQKKYYGRIPTLSTLFFLYTRPGVFLDSRLFAGRYRRRDRYEDLGDFDHPVAFTDGGSAFCCTLIPRRVIEEIGFFDERFPVFFNDGDLATRLFRAGYRAYLLPHVEALHHGGASVRRLDSLTYSNEFAYGLRAYCRKHKGRLYTLAVEALLGFDLLPELAGTGREILAGRKEFSDLLAPIRSYRQRLTYTPPNARRKSGEAVRR